MKKIFVTFFIFICFFVYTYKVEATDINSKNAILYNVNENKIMYEKNKSDRIPIASMTKIMTTIVAIENIKNLNEKVTLTSYMFNGLVEANASVAGFRIGELVTYKDLLYGAMLPSGADATQSLAVLLSGSEYNFVKLMNKKAKKLGMKNTVFKNTSGLDVNGQYSTVHDISMLLNYAYENKTFKKIFESKKYTTSNERIKMKSTVSVYMAKNNINMGYFKGGKTGYTEAAGFCLASVSNYNGTTYVLVTAKAPVNIKNTPYHVMDAKRIYDYYFINYKYYNIVDEGQTILALKTNSSNKTLSFYAPKTIKVFSNREFDSNDIEVVYDGINSINYNALSGTELGTVKIMYKGKVYDTYTVLLNQNIYFDIKEFSMEESTSYMYTVLFGFMVFLTFSLFRMIKNRFEIRVSG